VAKLCVETYKRGNKILIAGNGGSAADAQHFAGELVSRFNFDRPPLSAIALTTDTSILTAIGNDYGFDDIFARQLLANGRSGDVFIAISTSGDSRNILKALELASKCSIETVGLTGNKRGAMIRACSYIITVPSSSTPVIQECHIAIEHILCQVIESMIFGQP
jgi:D-sedoheptulose 7-phosphate isomerase